MACSLVVPLNCCACSFQVMLEFIVFGGMIQQMMLGGSSKIQLDIPLLIDAAFAAGAAMISFGAVLGRTTPSQIAWLLALQVNLCWLPRWPRFLGHSSTLTADRQPVCTNYLHHKCFWWTAGALVCCQSVPSVQHLQVS